MRRSSNQIDFSTSSTQVFRHGLSHKEKVKQCKALHAFYPKKWKRTMSLSETIEIRLIQKQVKQQQIYVRLTKKSGIFEVKRISTVKWWTTSDYNLAWKSTGPLITSGMESSQVRRKTLAFREIEHDVHSKIGDSYDLSKESRFPTPVGAPPDVTEVA